MADLFDLAAPTTAPTGPAPTGRDLFALPTAPAGAGRDLFAGTEPPVHNEDFWHKYLHPAFGAGQAAQHWAANLPGIRDIGNVWQGAKNLVLNQPVSGLHLSASQQPTGTVGQAAGEAISRVEKPVAEWGPFRALGDWMRAHPETSQDVLWGTNLASWLIPGARAGVGLARTGLGRLAGKEAAEMAAGEAEKAIPKPKVPEIGTQEALPGAAGGQWGHEGEGMGNLLQQAGIPVPPAPKTPGLKIPGPGLLRIGGRPGRIARGVDEALYQADLENTRDGIWLSKLFKKNPALRGAGAAQKDQFVKTWLSQRMRQRANDFLAHLRETPEFAEVATPFGNETELQAARQMHPGWVQTKMLGFNKFLLEPRIAAVLDRYAARAGQMDIDSLIGLNRFLVGTMFWNPIAHWPNLIANYLPELGRQVAHSLTPAGLVKGGPFRLAYNFGSSLMSVIRQDGAYQAMMGEGFPGALGASERGHAFHEISLQAAREAMEPGVAKTLTNIFNTGPLKFANPVQLNRWLLRVSNYATWAADDTLRMSMVKALQSEGLELREAIAEANRFLPGHHMPAYTELGPLTKSVGIPAGKLLNSHVLTIFNNYHQGVLKMIASMAGQGAVDRAALIRAYERLVGAGLLYFYVMPQADRYIQQVLHNKRAGVRRAGFMTIPNRIQQAAKETRGEGINDPGSLTPWVRAAELLVTPSPLLQGVTELHTGRDSFGRPVSAGQALRDFIPVGRNIQQIQQDPRKGLEQMIGISQPKFLPEEAKVKFAQQDWIQQAESGYRTLIMSGPAGLREARKKFRHDQIRFRQDVQAMLAEDRRRGISPFRVLGMSPGEFIRTHKPKWPTPDEIAKLRRMHHMEQNP